MKQEKCWKRRKGKKLKSRAGRQTTQAQLLGRDLMKVVHHNHGAKKQVSLLSPFSSTGKVGNPEKNPHEIERGEKVKSNKVNNLNKRRRENISNKRKDYKDYHSLRVKK